MAVDLGKKKPATFYLFLLIMTITDQWIQQGFQDYQCIIAFTLTINQAVRHVLLLIESLTFTNDQKALIPGINTLQPYSIIPASFSLLRC